LVANFGHSSHQLNVLLLYHVGVGSHPVRFE
jgi:hypothetical protein